MRRLEKIGVVILVFLLALGGSAQAVTETTTTLSFEGDLEEEAGKKLLLNAGLGMVSYLYKDPTTGESKTENLLKISACPTYKVGPLSAGLEVNYLVAEKEKRQKLGDTGKNPVIVRFVQYQKEPYFARWGILERVTLGNGMIMNNYSTAATRTSSVHTNKDKGVMLGYKATISDIEYSLHLLGTQTHVYGGRLSEKFPSKLTLGQTLVTDRDSGGNLTVFGLDAKMPVLPKMDAYLDFAKINKQGSGFALGTIWKGTDKITWRNEFRSFGSDFAPGIFDSHYETNVLTGTLPTTSPQSKNGFLSKLSLDLAQQLKASIAYENYRKVEPRLIGEAVFNLSSEQGGGNLRNLRGKVTYEQQNFRGKADPQKAIIKGEILTSLSKTTNLVINYTKFYDHNNLDANGDPRPVESVNYGIRLNL